MKLKYKILFIEDTPKSVVRETTKTREYLEDDYGFECLEEDIVVIDYEDFEELYLNKVDEDTILVRDDIKKFDLLMVDFDLGEKQKTGDNLIKIIRNSNIYSEILFYSSNYEQLRAKLNSNFIDGVFTSNRDELLDEIKKLIKVTIKKVQDVNNLRGLIMAEVAELDRIKESILRKFSEKNNCGTIEKYLIDKLNKSYNDNLKKVGKFSSSTLNDIFENLYIDSDKRARAIKKIEDTFDESTYRENILCTRNKFAHIEESSGDDGQGKSCPIIGDIPFTEEKCISIRKEIKAYKKILMDIKNSI